MMSGRPPLETATWNLQPLNRSSPTQHQTVPLRIGGEIVLTLLRIVDNQTQIIQNTMAVHHGSGPGQQIQNPQLHESMADKY